LLGAAGAVAGLILPSYYDKVFAYFENTGEPLIEAPRNPAIQLYAVDRGGYGLELNWGDPWDELPEMTVREIAHQYWGSIEKYLEWLDDEENEVDLDAYADSSLVMALKLRNDCSSARAYRLLENIDLGPELSGAEAVGGLEFFDGGLPPSDYLGVEAVDEVSLSLLQKRLNDLHTGIGISMEKRHYQP
jgi:hypothetical protein